MFRLALDRQALAARAGFSPVLAPSPVRGPYPADTGSQAAATRV